MREIRFTGRFKRDYKREKSGRHGKTLDTVLMEVVNLLAADVPPSNANRRPEKTVAPVVCWRSVMEQNSRYAHSEYPHTWQTEQPPSCSTMPPHSGQAPRSWVTFSVSMS